MIIIAAGAYYLGKSQTPNPNAPNPVATYQTYPSPTMLPVIAPTIEASSPATQTIPNIVQINPSSGSIGIQVTIHGSGFTYDNYIKFELNNSLVGYVANLAATSGGTTLTFTLSDKLYSGCASSPHFDAPPGSAICQSMAVAYLKQNNVYNVSVVNKLGASNQVTFKFMDIQQEMTPEDEKQLLPLNK